MERAIVFDGDDTLWHTEWLYDDARRQARQVAEAAGLDGAKWEEFERQIDVINVERLGHSVERFPTSCMEAYESLAEAAGLGVDAAMREQVGAAARTVFTRRAPLVTSARETLAVLRARGYRLALLTKGDPALQRRRIDESGLAPLFDSVEIVERKTPEVIHALLGRLGVEPTAAFSVGNSIRSDVLPALAAGVQPIWIDAHVWEYEREHNGLADERVIEVEDLGRLLQVIGS
jgi:putative hydrolase of the HAD superfamily